MVVQGEINMVDELVPKLGSLISHNNRNKRAWVKEREIYARTHAHGYTEKEKEK